MCPAVLAAAPRRSVRAVPVVSCRQGRLCYPCSKKHCRRPDLTRPTCFYSAQRKQELALPAAVTAAVGAVMANPLVAEAAVTPSLKNLINSVVAGSVVLGAIALAITAVSNFDRVVRR